MRKFSIIIPVYNRPDELDELLGSLTKQTYTNFEVVVVEDGSTEKSEDVAKKYSGQLDIHYYFKENSGQGFSRNFGFEKASGDYFIIFDSDILVPPDYLSIVNKRLDENYLDAFGGPDTDHPSFSPVQKAISYSMTSIFTTGGIRGNKNSMGRFHPRSFNMGLSRAVYDQCGGFKITRMAEDLEFSIRIIKAGFKVDLIADAVVYHKRRTSFSQFFRQLHFFGRGRINILRYFPDQLKLVHTFPAAFTVGLAAMVVFAFLTVPLFKLAAAVYILYFALIFFDALERTETIKVACLSVVASFIQLFAYGVGFLTEFFNSLIKKR